MRKGILAIMMLGGLFGPPSNVQKAKEAFEAKKYQEAANLYTSELDNYPTQRTALEYNIAQSWHRLDSNQKAMSGYGKVTNMSKADPQLASWAWNNIGCIQASTQQSPQGGPMMSPGASAGGPIPIQGMQGGPNAEQQPSNLDLALQSFKDALKLDHNNEIARYNYELVKRKLQQQQQEQQQKDQNEDKKDQQKEEQDKNKNEKKQDGQNESPENKENKQNQQGKGDGEQGNPQQMTAAEAQRLLDAMNTNEKKFIQQIEKGKKHRVYEDNNGHDW